MTRPATAAKSDSQIQQEVLRELKWDSRVSETEIGVIVKRGLVTLTGFVNSYAKKIAAQEAAHRVAGVLDVANDIEVKMAGAMARTDSDIAQAVRRALEWDVWVDAERIRSTVSDGCVTLDGEVSLLREREDAERAIRRLVGVYSVTNNITVSGKKVNEAEVCDAIEEALERRAERQAKHIKVRVLDGAVTITGPVRNWGEKRAILGAVSHASGVRKVDDHLFIDTPL